MADTQRPFTKASELLAPGSPSESVDWQRAARLVLLNREIERIERDAIPAHRPETYQFSTAGHDLAQTLLGMALTHPRDGVAVYYRSRALLLAMGMSPEEIFTSVLGRAGGMSSGRDLGVVHNMPSEGGPTVLPMAGDVGSQFTPAVGWAEALRYRQIVLADTDGLGALAVAHAGDGAVAATGFWSALLTATTLELPVLFYIEDNGLSISAPSALQVPGGNIASNLSSFRGLTIIDGDGTEPTNTARRILMAVHAARTGTGPVLLRMSVPRLRGHSSKDDQPYRDPDALASERSRDPLPKLRDALVPSVMSDATWRHLERSVESEVAEAARRALARPEPDVTTVTRFVFDEAVAVTKDSILARREPAAKPSGITLREAIRRTLSSELASNPKVLVFGQDVGRMGGVLGVTRGLQQAFGKSRVFDTNLSEEGIIGRATGMALAGLKPVAEIQFRKYVDDAAVQLRNCGTIRWRTHNRFSASVVVRIPVGFAKINDPWHSETSEAEWARAVGLRVAYPSNAQDAVGLLRAAMRGTDPTLFLEHRALLRDPEARRPYPGDDFVLPFGVARLVTTGSEITVVTWGAMVSRCQSAAERSGHSVELIDLRTLQPWDSSRVIESVRRTGRCLVVHEDRQTGGFGAEVVSVVSDAAFFSLQAPVSRLAAVDAPVPFNPRLVDHVLPGVDLIASRIRSLVAGLLED